MSDTAETPVVSHRRPNYLLIFGVLTVLTVLEVYLANIVGPLRNPVLLGASFIKAALVVAYYMHLRYDTKWYTLVFVLSFPFVLASLFMIGE